MDQANRKRAELIREQLEKEYQMELAQEPMPDFDLPPEPHQMLPEPVDEPITALLPEHIVNEQPLVQQEPPPVREELKLVHSMTMQTEPVAARPEKEKKKQRKKQKRKGGSPAVAAGLIFLAAVAGYAARSVQQDAAPPNEARPSGTVASELPEPAAQAEPTAPAAVAESKKIEPNGAIGLLYLANTQNPLPEGYVPPELTDMDKEGRQLDARAAAAYWEMEQAARADGCALVMVSGYRSMERQQELFVEMVLEYLSMGYKNGDAYAATKSLRNVPGTSEHQTGLAADIVANSHWEMNESYAQTKEAKWLRDNAARFGFILRYPENKTNITGTKFEPWHYRYVGKEHAERIMEQGLCLEEYLLQLEQGGIS